jgi:hypothetical protein
VSFRDSMIVVAVIIFVALAVLEIFSGTAN